MHIKEYTELMKHLNIEQEWEEKKRLVNSVRKVQDGKNVSLEDVERIRTVVERNAWHRSKGVNLNYIAIQLERDVSLSKEKVFKSKQKMKRKGLDLERLRRQRRIQQVREFKERTVEKEVEGR